MTKIEITTLVIAIWGAVLATISLVWNLLRDISHQGKLRVHCYRGKIVGGGISDENTYLVYSVTNVGKEPIVLSNFGGTTSDEKYNAFCITLDNEHVSKMLQPGDHIIQRAEIDILDDNLLTLSVTDTLGRTFECPKKTVKALIQQQKKANQSSEPILDTPSD